MKAMILAAGRGERMRPLTDTVPKPLLPVRGNPLIQWHIERLREAGFAEIVVNVSWLKERIIDFVGDGSRFDVRIEVSVEPPGALETAGGIVHVLPRLGERFVVVNGDIWTDFDFNLLQEQPAVDDLAHLVMVSNPDHHPAGDFAVEAGRLLASGGNQKFTFSGIGVYRRALFANVSPGICKLAPLLREAMQDKRVSGSFHAGEWSDVGTPARLAELNDVPS